MAGALQRRRKPPGIAALNSWGIRWTFGQYQILVWTLTFVSYTLYHASRKPLSIVKGVLHPVQHPPSNSLNATIQGWAPYSGADGRTKLGELDFGFLLIYSFGMYFSGQLADRLNLRTFLAVGMLGSGLLTCLFGMGFFWKIHTHSFFLLVNMVAGLFQATGWPTVVAVMAHWHGKEGRGLIMGVWNAHTSLGNIIGSLLASAVLFLGWGWAFLVPGIAITLGGIAVLMLLPGEPEDVGHQSPHVEEEQEEAEARTQEAQETGRVVRVSHVSGENADLKTPLLPGGAAEETERSNSAHCHECAAGGKGHHPPLLSCVSFGEHSEHQGDDLEAVDFLHAWGIPGVASYAFALFFAKLVAYTFLNWLPFYISHIKINGEYMDDSWAGVTSTVYDVGGVLGGILAGHLSDEFGTPAIVSAAFTVAAVPMLWIYYTFGHMSLLLNIGLLALVGFCVNAPYALITCAVSADLGQHDSLKGNSRALSTITGIIDGTGSLGAALGPFFTGVVADMLGGWAGVFGMLMSSSALSLLCMSKLVLTEWRGLKDAGDILQ